MHARRNNPYSGATDQSSANPTTADAVIERTPAVHRLMRENRAFLGRVVRYLASEAGIRQFISIGAGLPLVANTHQIAQAIAPGTRMVYVDNEPQVFSHAHPLLDTDNTAAIEEDLRKPAAILDHPDLKRLIDLSAPVAVLLLSMPHLLPDEEDPYRIAAAVRARVAPGSYLAISHAGNTAKATTQICADAAPTGAAREKDDVARFLGDWEHIDPGVVSISAWRPADRSVDEIPIWGGLARKPTPEPPVAGAVSVERFLEQLATAVRARNLKVSIDGAVLNASNPALGPEDLMEPVMSPGLSQKVMLQHTPDGAPMWCWIWEPLRPAERGIVMPPPEIEPFCTADDIDEAARRIAAVVGHRQEPSDG